MKIQGIEEFCDEYRAIIASKLSNANKSYPKKKKKTRRNELYKRKKQKTNKKIAGKSFKIEWTRSLPDPIQSLFSQSCQSSDTMRSNATPRNNFEFPSKHPSLLNEKTVRWSALRNLSRGIALKIYGAEEIHHKTEDNRGSPLFPRASGRGASPFFSLSRPADCSMERQCARPVRRWSICLNGQRHRPAAHNGRVGCQGHKSISRKRSKVARCIEARETAARRGFRSSRALSSYTTPAILRDWTPGEKYGSHLDKFSKENEENFGFGKNRVSPLMLLGERRASLFNFTNQSQM